MMIFVYLILGAVLLSICLGADLKLEPIEEEKEKNVCLMETIEIRKGNK